VLCSARQARRTIVARESGLRPNQQTVSVASLGVRRLESALPEGENKFRCGGRFSVELFDG